MVGLSRVLSPRLVDDCPPLESPHDLSSVSLCVQIPSSYKDSSPTKLRTTHKTSFNLNYPLKCKYLINADIVTRRTRTSAYSGRKTVPTPPVMKRILSLHHEDETLLFPGRAVEEAES